MTNEQWADLTTAAISQYTVGQTLSLTAERAVFRVTAPPEHAAAGSCLVIREAPDRSTCEAERNRYLEAMFLQHHGLVRIYDAGCYCAAGQWLHFAVTEPLEEPLTDVRDTVEPEVWASVGAALTYLHENHLVYCTLSPESIWRASGVWKLGDFSELRAEGDNNTQETRRLMIRPDLSVPPEAWEGIVTPAWDAWSLGTLLQRAGSRDPRVTELVEPSPSDRLTVADFLARHPATAMSPEPEQAPVPPDRPELPQPPTPVMLSPVTSIPVMAPPAMSNPVTPPPISVPPFRSANAERAHANASRVLRTPRRVVFWATLGTALGALLFVVAVLWGQREPAPRPEATVTTAPTGSVSASESSSVRPRNLDSNGQVDPKRQINALLARWVESTRARNLDDQVQCYAPVVERFFGGRNLRTEDLRRAKRDAFQTIGKVRDFDVSAVSFDSLRSDSAVISFRKRWDFPDRHFTGSERDQMELRRVGGQWKIVSEREIGDRKTELGGHPAAGHPAPQS